MPSVHDNIFTIGDLTFTIHKNHPYIIELKGSITITTVPLLIRKILKLKKVILDFAKVSSIDKLSTDMILRLSKSINIIVWNAPCEIKPLFNNQLICLPNNIIRTESYHSIHNNSFYTEIANDRTIPL